MSRPTPELQLLAVVATLERLASEVVDPRHALLLRAHASDLTKLAEAVTPKVLPSTLTPAQANVLAYVRGHIERHGEPPTRKEIADAFSYSSTNASQSHLEALQRKGHLTLTGEVRGIELNHEGPAK